MKIDKPVHLLGIDIRPSFVRLVELSYLNSTFKLEACINRGLTDLVMSDTAMVTAIKKNLQSLSFKTKYVVFALSHTLVIIREFQVVANLSCQEIEEFLRLKFATLMGESQEAIDFDFQVIEKETASDNLINLQGVAVRRIHTARWVKLLEEVGFYPKIIDVDIYAIERAVRLQLPDITGLTVVINIDYNQLLIVVLNSIGIVYTHEDIFDKENLNSIDHILELLDAKLCLICASLSQPFTKLVLGGEKAVIPGLCSAISSKFNLAVVLANPFLHMEISTTLSRESVMQLAPLMLISCGLALRVSNDDCH